MRRSETLRSLHLDRARSPVVVTSSDIVNRWRPAASASLDAGAELVAVIPRGELGRVLAWTRHHGSGAMSPTRPLEVPPP
jgi:hypothetical protein